MCRAQNTKVPLAEARSSPLQESGSGLELRWMSTPEGIGHTPMRGLPSAVQALQSQIRVVVRSNIGARGTLYDQERDGSRMILEQTSIGIPGSSGKIGVPRRFGSW